MSAHEKKPLSLAGPRSSAYALLFAAFLGCGACTSMAPSGGEPVASADASVGTAAAVLCPNGVPDQGTPCSSPDLECEYGSNPQFFCNVISACEAQDASAKWGPAAGPTDPNSPVCSPNAGCAASYAQQPSQPKCQTGDSGPVLCMFPEGVCSCDPASGWQCQPLPDGCPYPRPRMGERCTAPGLSCDYGGCFGGLTLVCAAAAEGNYWAGSTSRACGH